MAIPPSNAFHPVSRNHLRAWLEENHTQTEGIWLINFKKETGQPRLEYNELVEELLCFGWIDSLPHKLDTERSMLWIAPRKRGSNWSALNKQRVAQLIKAKKMTTAGLEKIEQAKIDGSWTALDQVELLEVPNDLKQALSVLPHATQHFASFPRSVKRGILEWIVNAKKMETREKRVQETARLAELNLRANQWKK